MNNPRTISILGSTGSIGTQALDVIGRSGGKFDIAYLTVDTNIEELEKQTQRFNPKAVVVCNSGAYSEFRKQTRFKGKILSGEYGLHEAAAYDGNDLVISALVGFAGVVPTIKAIEAGKTIALANKEALVSAGSIITKAAKDNNVDLIAVDSEHNAILQCLAGEKISQVEKIILTASGGPFRDTPLDEFDNITVARALDHPNWTMGSKITIDSATMMNKGFEIIEARWLFGLPVSQIEVLIHPQSIIHSMVYFVDGSVKAQLGMPDMRIPISYALTYPDREKYDFPRLDLGQIGALEFYRPDYDKYPCLRLALEALEAGGTATAIVNAANEVAVRAFLNGRISFTGIHKIINKTIEKKEFNYNPSLDDIINADTESRYIANSLIN